MPLIIAPPFRFTVPLETVVDDWSPAYSVNFQNDFVTTNFGASAFGYSVPSGYTAYGSSITWSSANSGPGIVLTDGDLTASSTNAIGIHDSGISTTTRPSGKWYWETTMTYVSAGGTCIPGILKFGQNLEDWCGSQAGGSVGTFQNGNTYHNAAQILTANPFASGETMRHKLDIGANTYEFAIEGGSFKLVNL